MTMFFKHAINFPLIYIYVVYSFIFKTECSTEIESNLLYLMQTVVILISFCIKVVQLSLKNEKQKLIKYYYSMQRTQRNQFIIKTSISQNIHSTRSPLLKPNQNGYSYSYS